MTTVREFIQWLETFPDQDATVEILEHTSEGGYYCQGGTVDKIEFDVNNPDHYMYTDLRGNPFISVERDYFNKRYLFIGNEK